MWTVVTRPRQSRTRLRASSNLTDAEWALLKPFLPAQT